MESNIPNFNDITAIDIDGNKKFIKDFLVDKKIGLIVNVASACGYTKSNYKQLAELHKKYSEKGLQILAFPCNQFGGQEPKCELDIKKFATEKYEVKFPIFSKIEVNGENTHPLYIYLKYNSQKMKDKDGNLKNIPWNFAKFLIDGKGSVINYYPHDIPPKDIEKDFEKFLI